MSKACIDRSDSLIFQHKRRPRVIGFTWSGNELRRTRTESETFYRSIMTAVDSIKCRCANLGMTGQVQTSSGPSGWFSKSPGLLPWVPEVFLACSGNRARKVCGTQSRGLSASGSFLSSPPPARSFTCAIFRAVFDSRSSFFAPKPHGNACYAG